MNSLLRSHTFSEMSIHRTCHKLHNLQLSRIVHIHVDLIENLNDIPIHVYGAIITGKIKLDRFNFRILFDKRITRTSWRKLICNDQILLNEYTRTLKDITCHVYQFYHAHENLVIISCYQFVNLSNGVHYLYYLKANTFEFIERAAAFEITFFEIHLQDHFVCPYQLQCKYLTLINVNSYFVHVSNISYYCRKIRLIGNIKLIDVNDVVVHQKPLKDQN